MVSPWVTSASSPPSFTTPQTAVPSFIKRTAGAVSTAMPLGVSSERVSGRFPESRKAAAPAAASAAQVPVVYPQRSCLCPLRM